MRTHISQSSCQLVMDAILFYLSVDDAEATDVIVNGQHLIDE